MKNLVLSSNLSDNSQYIGKLLDLPNLFFRDNSKTGKQVHSKRIPQTCHIIRYFSRNISTFSIFKNVSLKALVLSSLDKSEKENIDSDSNIPTASRVITNKLFSKKVPSFKLSTTFSASIPKAKAFILSWNN